MLHEEHVSVPHCMVKSGKYQNKKLEAHHGLSVNECDEDFTRIVSVSYRAYMPVVMVSDLDRSVTKSLKQDLLVLVLLPVYVSVNNKMRFKSVKLD